MKTLQFIMTGVILFIGQVTFGQESTNATTENKQDLHNSITAKPVKKGPIYIVNDKEVNEDYADKINPRDIKSVYVLNEKKAQLVYGPKGKDGAIVITTNLSNQK